MGSSAVPGLLSPGRARLHCYTARISEELSNRTRETYDETQVGLCFEEGEPKPSSPAGELYRSKFARLPSASSPARWPASMHHERDQHAARTVRLEQASHNMSSPPAIRLFDAISTRASSISRRKNHESAMQTAFDTTGMFKLLPDSPCLSFSTRVLPLPGETACRPCRARPQKSPRKRRGLQPPRSSRV